MDTKKVLAISAFSSIILGACIPIGNSTPTQTNDDASMEDTSSETDDAMMEGDDAMMEGDSMMEDHKSYTLEQVAEHSTPDDCWLALSGKVYDVTPFIASGNHPGGEAILQGCGKDATEYYETRPMGSGTPHSSTARSFLPDFEIGSLAEE